MNVQPHHRAFAAFPKQNDKCLTNAGRGGGMGMFGIDRANKNKDVWFSFQVLMKKVIFFFRRQRKTERVCSGTWYIMLQVKIKFRLKFFNLCLFSISFVS